MPSLNDLVNKPYRIENRLQDVLGMDPNVERRMLLPDYDPQEGFIAPEWVYEAAKAIMLPGHAMQGGDYDEGDVLNMAGAISGPGAIRGSITRQDPNLLGMNVAHISAKDYGTTGATRPPYAEKSPVLGPDLPPELLDAGRKVEYDPNDAATKTIAPEDLEGSYIQPLYGDRSDRGVLQQILGVDLANPVNLQAGKNYMLGPNGAWASGGNIPARLSRDINSVEEDVYGVYVPMGGTSSDYAHMTLDTMKEHFDPSQLTKANVRTIDSAIAKHMGRDDILSFTDPRFVDQFANDVGRAEVAKALSKKEIIEAGGPNMAVYRHAIADPELRYLPVGNEAYGGQSIARMQKGDNLTPMDQMPDPHKTYDLDLGGEYVGGFDAPIARSLMFRDWFNGRREAGSPIASDNYSFDRAKPMQYMDAELVDTLMQFIERTKQ